MPSPARPLRRASRAAAVVLLVLAQLGALAHEAAVRHVRCAEHGELVEAATIAAHHEAGVRLVGVELGISGDDHCTLAGALNQHVTAPTARLAPTTISSIPAPTPTLRATPLRSFALYRFAPKTSPPARTQLS